MTRFNVLKELEALLDARRDQGGTITRVNENDAILRLEEKIRADERGRTAPEARFAKDAARYRKLVSQAVEGDWGGFVGWRLTVDIPGAPSMDNIDDAIDAAFPLPCAPQPQGGHK